VAGSFLDDNEPRGPVRDRIYLDQLRDPDFCKQILSHRGSYIYVCMFLDMKLNILSRLWRCVTIDGVCIGEIDLLTTCIHHSELHFTDH
jgi:hypothetical protein